MSKLVLSCLNLFRPVKSCLKCLPKPCSGRPRRNQPFRENPARAFVGIPTCFSLHCTIPPFFSSRKKADWKTFGWRKMQPIMVKLVCLLQLHFKQTLLVQAFSGGFTDKLPDSSHHGPLTTETQKGLQWLLATALCNALEDPFSFSKIFFSSGFQTLWFFVVFLAEKVLTRKTLQNAFHFFVCVYFYFAADFFSMGTMVETFYHRFSSYTSF